MYKGMCKTIQVWISCLRLVSRPPKSECFFGKFTTKPVWKSFSGRNNSLEPSVCFDFLTVSHMVWKNQESCESWLVGFGVSRCLKMQKISANNFFFGVYDSCHYGFTNYFEILIFAFSNTIPRVVSNCKLLLF